MNLQENISRIKQMMGLLTEEEQDNTKKNILYPLSTNGNKTLILLPGAGGKGGNDFNELTINLGDKFSIYTADFDNELDVRKYAKNIAEEINNNPNINSFAVGGFSIGGSIAWHLSKELKALKSKEFNNKLFFIDSGIPNSTDEFIENMVRINTPRLATAQPLNIFIKNRNGENLTPEEEEQILKFYSNGELNRYYDMYNQLGGGSNRNNNKTKSMNKLSKKNKHTRRNNNKRIKNSKTKSFHKHRKVIQYSRSGSQSNRKKSKSKKSQKNVTFKRWRPRK